MRSVTIRTRTLSPTDTLPKRVRVSTSEGLKADYPWDQRYDGPQVHENAARKAALLGNPDATVRVDRTGSDDAGYTFRAIIDA